MGVPTWIKDVEYALETLFGVDAQKEVYLREWVLDHMSPYGMNKDQYPWSLTNHFRMPFFQKKKNDNYKA